MAFDDQATRTPSGRLDHVSFAVNRLRVWLRPRSPDLIPPKRHEPAAELQDLLQVMVRH